ncbi:type III secretion system protein SctP [Trinickia sp.]|uniref:type III secretion system protein SctP n=1 Tax=Trinickia sp. TaxID=2571163 RepID=UPI003F8062B7
MTDRVRHPQDVRIVPSTTPASPSTLRTSSNATAVQIFRLLASQAGAGPLPPLAAPGDDHPGNPHDEGGDSDGSDTGGSASDTTVPEPARAESPPPPAIAPPHSEPSHEASAPPTVAGTRTLSRREARAPEAPAGPAAPEQDAALGKQIVHACAVAAHGELFTRELAERIARFCSTSGASGDASWAVTLPMNPAVLPDTLLHLQLSPSSIGIRFETPNPRSTQLISDNADALRMRLADALGRHIDLDIGA